MKEISFILLFMTLSCVTVFSQTKKTVRHTSTSLVAKQKAKVKAEAEDREKARISENNTKCYFSFRSDGFVSEQGYDDYVIYLIPEMSSSDLKGSVFTALSSMYKSPKDAITSLSDNMVQLDGYAKDVYIGLIGGTAPSVSLLFNMVIQFKDGKIRYNKPTIKQMILDDYGREKVVNVTQPISILITSDVDRRMVEKYFRKLIESINAKLVKSNDW